ncbi:MAG: protein translocase subunit SecD [Verrucomicrobiae bacterium]|nr:protein translocase subunit SecD [Verrucomicrobiae bacterium]
MNPLLKRLLLVLAFIGIAIYYIYPPEKKITLGLDLKGGTQYVLQLDLAKIDERRQSSAVDKAIEILRKRLDKSGVGEIILQPRGKDRIEVQIPGLKEADKLQTRKNLERVAYLEFRLVHPQNNEELARMKQEGGLPPIGYELMRLQEKRSQGAPIDEQLLVKRNPELTGKHLVRAAPMNSQGGGYEVAFELSSDGGDIFRRVTRENIGNRLAILLDKKVMSAPRINSEIGSRGVITGDFDYKDAFELANVLENPLETPVAIIEERSVEPTLGMDSIKSGAMAGIIGIALVVVFMVAYYLRAGLIANVALLINVILLFGVLAIFKFTLTLPGIAGIILTIGIAVDANVLIYERIREELRKGKPLAAAIDAGFNRAFGTIMDANITTLITSVVLMWLGRGPVQGFGVTLSAGIVTSVFSAMVVSRMIFDFLLLNNKMNKLTMLSMVSQTNIKFLSFRLPAFALSAVIIMAGLMLFIQKGEKAYGVDFTGGDAVSFDFKRDARVDVSALRDAVLKAGIKDSFIQYQKELSGEGEVLYVKVKFGEGETVRKALSDTFPQAGFTQRSFDSVGGAIGGEIKQMAVLGLGVASVLILIFITARFEFAYAVGAIASLLHDVLICMAFLFFTDRQLSLPVLGALLTIAGYSLNDTIVVFDRIREEFKLKGEGYGFANLINLSINETLSRTLLTSLTTFIAAFSLYLFGGGVINDFAFVLVIGIITGTYSSVFIASPFLLLQHPSKLKPQEAPSTPGAQKQKA